jgi:molybdopterin-guanine dinucleotide biosynthesis protein A
MTNLQVTGVLLAGGLSRRMGGGDKSLVRLSGRAILDRVIERARPQVSRLVLNANGDPERFAAFGLPIVPDSVANFPGPLAGVLAGLDWASAHGRETAWVASFATDAPFLPCDLVARLLAAAGREGAALAGVRAGGRDHPVFGLWSLSLREALRHALVAEGIRKVDAWTARYPMAVVDYPTEPADPFFNLNHPDDLAAAERLLASGVVA